MKIAIFSDCYLDLVGGIVTSINSQKNELEKRGHEVYIFSTAYEKTKKETDELAKKNIFIVPCCKKILRGVTPISRRPAIVEKWLLENHQEIKDFDVFYVHYEAGCSIAGLRLGKKLKVPTIQVMHGREDMGESSIVPFGFRTIVATLLNWFHSWYIPHKIRIPRDDYLADTIAKAKMWTLMVNHANYADIVVTPSEHMKKKLHRYGVVRNIYVVPNGLPDSSFPLDPAVKNLKKGEELRMVWHSRVSPEKRMMVFLRALHMVDGKYRLDVYGDGGDFKKAKRFIKRHKLNVVMHGSAKFETVRKAIKKAHLDILVSYNFDNHPLTIVEAEVNGLPVLICDKDMAGLMPQGGYILAKNETPIMIADTINDLIENPQKIASMSRVMLKNRDKTKVSASVTYLEKIIKMFSD